MRLSLLLGDHAPCAFRCFGVGFQEPRSPTFRELQLDITRERSTKNSQVKFFEEESGEEKFASAILMAPNPASAAVPGDRGEAGVVKAHQFVEPVCDLR